MKKPSPQPKKPTKKPPPQPKGFSINLTNRKTVCKPPCSQTVFSCPTLPTAHLHKNSELLNSELPIYLVGPTGSGKSALALALAEHIGGEIVNADAFQIYRSLDICTAKPSVADLARAPHHLYSVLASTELCDAQFYSELAHSVIADIIARGKTPIIVGGSGLYVKALTHGLSNLPSDEGVRQQLAALTPHERIEWLLVRDPDAAQTVSLQNDRYVTRALEICLLTNQPQSALRKAWTQQQPSFRGVRLVWERAALCERINQRVLSMIQSGLVAEIAALPALSTTAEKAIGVREIRAYHDGQLTLEEAITALQAASRQYARRQEKWFKRESGFKIVPVNETDSMEELLCAVTAAVRWDMTKSE